MRIKYVAFAILSTYFLFSCGSSKPRHEIYQSNAPQLNPSLGSNLNDKIVELSNQIYQTILAQNVQKVAVLPFTTLQGKQCDLGFYITDKLSNNLFTHRDKFEVLDRLHIEKVLRELELSEKGIIDPSDLKKLGKFLGADIVIVGNFSVLAAAVDVTAKALDTEKMSVLGAAETQLFRSKDVDKLIYNCGIEGISLQDDTNAEQLRMQSTSQARQSSSFTSSNIFSISYYGSDESYVGDNFELLYYQDCQDFRIEAKTLPNEHAGEMAWQLDDGTKQRINGFRFRVPNSRDGGHIMTIDIPTWTLIILL